MLFAGTFDVWFPTSATRASAHFRSSTHPCKHYGFHSRKFSSLWCEKTLYPMRGRKSSQPERPNYRIASSISHTGADRFPGNEPANYRLQNLEVELAKVSACCQLVNRPGNSNCQPLGNIFNGGLTIHKIKSRARLPRDRICPCPKGSSPVRRSRDSEPPTDGVWHRASERVANCAKPAARRIQSKAHGSVVVGLRASTIFRMFSLSVSPPASRYSVIFVQNRAVPYRERLNKECDLNHESLPTPRLCQQYGNRFSTDEYTLRVEFKCSDFPS